jgi:transmembrane sensor
MEPEDKYRYLLNKYLADECTESELNELFAYLQKSEANRMLADVLKKEFHEDEHQNSEVPIEITDRIWNRLEENITPPVKIRPINYKKWLSVAAAMLIFFSASLFIYRQLYPDTTNIAQHKQQIVPGGNKAILTLANGTKIVLNEARSGTLVTQGSTLVKKEGDGRLAYDILETPDVDDNLSYNTVATPRGGQYNIILPDGTNVWLNAESSLRFPTVFNGDHRNVELTGEAYFEVAKDKHKPFTITANAVKVEVLGTHFNVNAYNDESTINTVLLEGRVKVSSNTTVMLSPGQQAKFNRRLKTIAVGDADIEEAVAWKNGYFMFANEDLHKIMRKVSRWYNVDVVYKDDLADLTFWGNVSRFENVSQVLKTLELTGTVHFKIEGRRIIVMR